MDLCHLIFLTFSSKLKMRLSQYNMYSNIIAISNYFNIELLEISTATEVNFIYVVNKLNLLCTLNVHFKIDE